MTAFCKTRQRIAAGPVRLMPAVDALIAFVGSTTGRTIVLNNCYILQGTATQAM
ncbi:hypothetical protein [Variovorax sp. E3]|uniref:hypothetical protein n=1 Tax=Variovorax sp. E3 TaxID=1914993 RepID=UPI0018DD21EF|nr:hypothetical protein [Variovorax sp. E3]